MNYKANDKNEIYEGDPGGNLKLGPYPRQANAPDAVYVYNRNDDASGQKTESRTGIVLREAVYAGALNTEVRDPLTHDYVIYAGITLIMALLVVMAHISYRSLAVAEWQLSKGIENLPSLSPWVVIGGAVVLGLMVILIPRLRNKIRQLAPS